MPKKEQFDRRKLTALVHYICASCDDPAVLGGTKLNKVLWYADVNAFIERGHSITGETYVKQQFGPVAQHLLPVVEDLKANESIVVRQAPHFAFTKWEYIALKSPDISMFKPEEISLVDDLIQIVCHQNTAKSISRQTHDVIWELAEIGEEIPYSAVFASEVGEFTKDDMAWAKREVAKMH